MIQVLASIDSWHDFDVSHVAEHTCAPLRVTSLAAFEVLGLLNSLKLPRNTLEQYLLLLEALYPRCVCLGTACPLEPSSTHLDSRNSCQC